jgi:hypothetical protein
MTSQHPCRRPARQWRLAETDQHQDTLGIGAQLSPVILTEGREREPRGLDAPGQTYSLQPRVGERSGLVSLPMGPASRIMP